jgi:hypothetical protein
LVLGAGTLVRNPAALAKANRRIAEARTRNVIIGLYGDSTAAGSDATAIGTLPTNDTAVNQFGIVGVIRSRLNAMFGTKGGAWISVASTGGQVTRSGGTLMAGYGPHYNLSGQNSYSLTGAGQYAEFAVPACTQMQVMQSETTVGNYSGSVDVSVDGGAPTTYTGPGGYADWTPVMWQVANMTGLSDAARTIRLTKNVNNQMLHGVLYGYDTGVTVFTMGVGSYTSQHLIGDPNAHWTPSAAQKARLTAASFTCIPLDVAIIIIGHNDCTAQTTRSLPPATVAANILSAITYLRANAGAPVILLVTDPAHSSAGTPYDYPDYWPYIMAIADGTTDVAAVTTQDFLGTYAQANAEGYYGASPHLTSAGHSVWGSYVADMLLDFKKHA